jgi:hypothetical protein
VTFLQLHKAAYGEARLKPKHHWQLDVPRQLQRDNMVLDAFVIERTHLAVKAVAEYVRNTTCFEATVLASLSSKIWTADEPVVQGLVGRHSALPGSDDAYVADRMEVFGSEVCVDDVVTKGADLGMVRACCLHRAELVAFVEVLDVRHQRSEHTCECCLAGRLDVWPAIDLQLAIAWRHLENGHLLVVRQ